MFFRCHTAICDILEMPNIEGYYYNSDIAFGTLKLNMYENRIIALL